jgi:hypothetical protein
MKFFPCTGDCLLLDEQCQSCGRTEEEIVEMSKSLDELVTFAEKMKYENLAEFADDVADSVKYKLGLGHS